MGGGAPGGSSGAGHRCRLIRPLGILIGAPRNGVANDFINSGMRVEVTIASSDYSFDSSACGEFVKQ
ncbi:hypothetical protein GCM10027415_28200 [Humibacter ginsengisoli]